MLLVKLLYHLLLGIFVLETRKGGIVVYSHIAFVL